MNDPTLLVTARRYRCGAIVIDPVQRQVSVQGETVRLGARAFDLLLVLLERRDRVVSKQELMDLVWPRLVVEENNLQVHVAALRKALGPQSIATIPGRGYQFALPVDGLEPAAAHGTPVAPAAHAEAARGNLPPSSTPLIGRVFDIAAVEALLRENPVVSIVGAGGIGKTRLALAAAAAAPGEFPDGRWWVELAPVVEAAEIPRAIANLLGLLSRSLESPVEAVADALATARALIVLDNCEHLADEVGPMLETLAARTRGIRWLVTSQEPLKCSGEQTYRLGGLAIPRCIDLDTAAQYGAVALFVERAHATDPRFRLEPDNVAAVIEICKRLDGIPLAIELAAARVTLLGVHGLAERLDQRFNVLSGGTRMKLRRHQTLRAALEWSYGLLSDDEQRVFRRLGVFAGGFTLELAQQLAPDDGIDEWAVLDLLGRLIDRSLVMAEGDPKPRYSLLETTRAFALEMLAQHGESRALLRRHAEVMRDFARGILAQRWTISDQHMTEASREINNLRAAIDWSLAEPSERVLACELLGASHRFFVVNRFLGEGRARIEKIFPLPEGLPAGLEADCNAALASFACSSLRDDCWKAGLRAVELYRELGDRPNLIGALLRVSSMRATRGEAAAVDTELAEAESLIDAHAPLLMQAFLANVQGFRYGNLGDHANEVAAFQRQAEFDRRSGSVTGELGGLGNVGYAQLVAGNLDQAIEILRDVIARFRELNSPAVMCDTLVDLCMALALHGGHGDVLPLCRECFMKMRRVGVAAGPVLAAALQHARAGDLRRAVFLCAATRHLARNNFVALCRPERQLVERLDHMAGQGLTPEQIDALQQRARQFTEAQVAAIAFDGAPFDGLPSATPAAILD